MDESSSKGRKSRDIAKKGLANDEARAVRDEGEVVAAAQRS
jgi:hypothetical protein